MSPAAMNSLDRVTMDSYSAWVVLETGAGMAAVETGAMVCRGLTASGWWSLSITA